MSVRQYLEDHIVMVVMQILFGFSMCFILVGLGIAIPMAVLLNLIWLACFTFVMSYQYMKKNRRLQQLKKAYENLDQKYLLHEVMPIGGTQEEIIYAHLMRLAFKDMLERVSGVNRERREYQEYIEQWVHEIKTPLAAMNLWCDNQTKERPRELCRQLERTRQYVEQALFYARSEYVAADFQVRSTSLLHVLSESLLACKYRCVQAHMKITLPDEDVQVMTDEKWLIFIIEQIIENAVKYRCVENPRLIIRFTLDSQGITLNLQDNGIGIQEEDLPRVFEKGFTGQNGRISNMHATGIGLYLCRRLCDQLGIHMKLSSIPTNGTLVSLHFPHILSNV